MSEASIGKGVARRLTLAANLDHTALQSLKSALIEALSDDRYLEIDASAVRRMSTPAIQLLVAARVGALSGYMGSIRFVSPSETFGDFARTLGLEETLGFEEASL
jgi:anti-anti-sigma regulatory factor